MVMLRWTLVEVEATGSSSSLGLLSEFSAGEGALCAGEGAGSVDVDGCFSASFAGAAGVDVEGALAWA